MHEEIIDIDAIGLLCPLPVLRLRKMLLTMPPGRVVALLADDPAAAVDIPHFCHEAGHDLVEQSITGKVRRFVVRAASSGDGS